MFEAHARRTLCHWRRPCICPAGSMTGSSRTIRADSITSPIFACDTTVCCTTYFLSHFRLDLVGISSMALPNVSILSRFRNWEMLLTTVRCVACGCGADCGGGCVGSALGLGAVDWSAGLYVVWAEGGVASIGSPRPAARKVRDVNAEQLAQTCARSSCPQHRSSLPTCTWSLSWSRCSSRHGHSANIVLRLYRVRALIMVPYARGMKGA